MHPVADQRGRADHQLRTAVGASEQKADGLHGFSQTHLVGEHRAAVFGGRPVQPGDPARLIGPQPRAQRLAQRPRDLLGVAVGPHRPVGGDDRGGGRIGYGVARGGQQLRPARLPCDELPGRQRRTGVAHLDSIEPIGVDHRAGDLAHLDRGAVGPRHGEPDGVARAVRWGFGHPAGPVPEGERMAVGQVGGMCGVQRALAYLRIAYGVL